MLVSVIIPNYNYGAYLTQAVESLMQQTHSPIELIIVDDASSDDSRAVIEALRRTHADTFERFEVILLDKNCGKLHALNLGIPFVSGEITIILDADDYLTERYVSDTVTSLLAARRENEKVAFVYTDCRLVDSQGDFLVEGKSSPFSREHLQRRSYIPDCAPTLTSVLEEVLPFDETIRVGTKHHKWKKIVAAGYEGLYLGVPLFHYRMHDANLSGLGRIVLDEFERGVLSIRILSSYWRTA